MRLGDRGGNGGAGAQILQHRIDTIRLLPVDPDRTARSHEPCSLRHGRSRSHPRPRQKHDRRGEIAGCGGNFRHDRPALGGKCIVVGPEPLHDDRPLLRQIRKIGAGADHEHAARGGQRIGTRKREGKSGICHRDRGRAPIPFPSCIAADAGDGARNPSPAPPSFPPPRRKRRPRRRVPSCARSA